MAKVFFLALQILGIIMSWGGWGYLIITTTPEEWVNQLLFFLLLFIAVLFTAATIAYRSSFWLFSFKRYQGSAARAFFQGIPIALLITGTAWLQSLRALSWSVAAIVVAIVCAVELLLLPRQTQ